MKKTDNNLPKKHIRFGLSIYGQVIYIIIILSIFLFVSFGVIFRSVNKKYMQSVITQSGDMVGSIVQGSLYRSMLRNDKNEIKNTLSVMNKMSGIDGIHIYNSEDSLILTSSYDTSVNPNCIECHENINSMFQPIAKSYKVINLNSDCAMNQKHFNSRHLLIRIPILNERTCSVSECHVHSESEKLLGSIVIISPLEGIDNTLHKSSTDFFLLAALTTILFLVFLILFTRKNIKKPLNAIIKASDAVSKGDMNVRLKITPNLLDDMRTVSIVFSKMIGDLVKTNIELENFSHQLEYKVNKMSQELSEVQNELILTEQKMSLGKLSSSVAHEINNPLSGIFIYTKLIHRQLVNQKFPVEKKNSIIRQIKMIEAETQRCGDIVKGLLDFSRKDMKEHEISNLHEILNATYNLMQHSVKITDINFIADFKATHVQVLCSPKQIKQACVALILNAFESIFSQGDIIIKTFNPDEYFICIQILDNGCGISEENLPHIFEPFFSTKNDENSVGLGLTIVKEIVENNKGKIELDSKLGKGTTISIIFPLYKN